MLEKLSQNFLKSFFSFSGERGVLNGVPALPACSALTTARTHHPIPTRESKEEQMTVSLYIVKLRSLFIACASVLQFIFAHALQLRPLDSIEF